MSDLFLDITSLIISLADIRKTLSSHKPVLEKDYGVKKIGIFGSYAHGTHTERSDIDILVELNRTPGRELMDLKLYLEEILGKEVDLVTVAALRPKL
ncbi:MAG: nucleotidyltransferase family protein [Candidatus Thermoplasmatota archaeon]|nr:nucleotidyltransferase family protein [Candidatus Thermoplasmatota archaeon]